MTTSEHLPATSSMDGAEPISSPPATPASRSLMPGGEWARRMTAISGRTLLRSSKTSGPLGACLRTLLDTSRWGSTTCYLTWKRSATPAKHSLYRLVPSMPRTGATGFGFLPTPDAGMVNGSRTLPPGTSATGVTPDGKKRQVGLVNAVKMLPTPTVNGNHNRAGLSPTSGDGLAIAVRRLLPTPRASANENRQTKPSPSQLAGKHGRSLAAEVSDLTRDGLLTTPTADDTGKRTGRYAQGGPALSSQLGGKLNPSFVEAMMGFPIGWTDLEPSETPSSPTSPTSS